MGLGLRIQGVGHYGDCVGNVGDEKRDLGAFHLRRRTTLSRSGARMVQGL